VGDPFGFIGFALPVWFVKVRGKPLETQSRTDVTPEKEAGPVEAVKAAAAEQIAPKPTRRWRARVFQAYLVVATAAFGLLVVLASMSNYFSVDLSVTRAVQTINVAWFASFMWGVSSIGYAPQMIVLVAAAAVLLLVIGLRWESVTVLAATAGSASLGELIKIVVHRPRPGAILVNVFQQLNSYSFPSGHVLTYTAFFGFLFFLGYTLLKPSFARTVLLAVLGSLVALVGVSRIYVGDHWASDVIGAYLLGSLWLVLTVYVYRWGKTRFFVRQPLAPEKPGPSMSQS
jgi:membrane-associated phospholipid phosphatase